jgi:hypothetical protein
MTNLTLNPGIIGDLSAGMYEHRASTLKTLLYNIERSCGNLFFSRKPPQSTLNLLNLGCGPLKYEGWCNADEFSIKRSFQHPSFKPDWRLDITRKWNCLDCFWDGVFSQHVLEHLYYSDAIFTLSEIYRTLKPRCWLRIVVPSLDNYLALICNSSLLDNKFPFPALAISNLTQMHTHKSTWSADLLQSVLMGVGFTRVSRVEFGQGNDQRLIMDQGVKKGESIYVEAMKPEAA